VSFRQVNKKTGNRLRQQLVDDETREPVDSDEVGKNEYLLMDDEELEALEIESITPSISTPSFPPRKSTSASMTAPTTSSRATRWAKKRSRSSAMR
jgi:DNA end-binding protein Ku